MLKQLRDTVRNSFLYSIGNMAGKLSGVILLPLYTKYLPVEDYGLLALLEVTYLFILAISGFGVKSALTRYYWDKDIAGREKILFFTSYLFNIGLSIVTILLSYLLIKRYSLAIFDVELSRRLILIFVGSSFLRLLADSPMLLLRIRQKAFNQTLIQIIILVITVGLTAYLMSIKGFGLEAVFYAQLAANGVALLLLSRTIIRNIEFRFDTLLLRELLQFGTPLFLSNLLTIVLVLSDRFILNFFGTLENVGNFSLAFKISNIIQVIFVTSFMSAYQHIFYKQMDEDNAGRFYTKTMTYFVLVIVFVSTGLVLFSKETIKVLSMGNEDYWNSYTLVPILVVGIVFGGIRQILILPLSRLKKTRIISTVSISAALLNFGLNLLLIPFFSSTGAAVATAITQAAASVWLYLLVRKHDTIQYELRKIAKCLVLGVVFYLVSVTMDDLGLAWRLTLKSLLYFSFIFILYAWKFYEPVELERLKGAWHKWRDVRNFRKNISEINIE